MRGFAILALAWAEQFFAPQVVPGTRPAEQIAVVPPFEGSGLRWNREHIASPAFLEHQSRPLTVAAMPYALLGAVLASLAVYGALRPRAALAVAGAAVEMPKVLPKEISKENPLRVLVAGGGVGGLTLANALMKYEHVDVTVLEKTSEFKRFGGPIQLASNALQVYRELDPEVSKKIEDAATYTGDKENGIKDGIRGDWYAKFDLGTPAEVRNMQYTCVVERPDLQQILLDSIKDHVKNGSGVTGYKAHENGVTATLDDGTTCEGDILVGADGIWSDVRAEMRQAPSRGDGCGASYSGYVVFAGELNYDSFDNGEIGYKVYIGPNQYFVITDIGKGRYQWYAFLGREPNSADKEPMPDGKSMYLQNIFTGWSEEIFDILRATKEDEIAIRDLYDRPPTVLKSWSDDTGRVTLMGDAVHAMMPNLGQGGCQAIEDALVISEEFGKLTTRNQDEVKQATKRYQNRRKARSAAVQGLSRFASDIIIRGFDTPAKVTMPHRDESGQWHGMKVENVTYNGVVTRMLQPVLPVFFSVQFNFLYSGWKNERGALEPLRDLLVLGPGVLVGGLAVEALLEGEGLLALQEGVAGGWQEMLNALESLF
jgi:zeaxanthin epoxidase